MSHARPGCLAPHSSCNAWVPRCRRRSGEPIRSHRARCQTHALMARRGQCLPRGRHPCCSIRRKYAPVQRWAGDLKYAYFFSGQLQEVGGWHVLADSWAAARRTI